jgi:hypothetical protein
LAVEASRSSLIGALLRTAAPVNRHSVIDFLRGLSRDELQCIADFQGACIIEMEYAGEHSYRLMADFFDPRMCDRWSNPCERAHKTFVILAWLDLLDGSVSLPFSQRSRAGISDGLLPII